MKLNASDRPTASRAVRIVVALCLAALAAGLAAGCSFLPVKSGSGAGTTEVISHTVSPGETLASIADDYYGAPGAASYLADVNNLNDGFAFATGITLEVPVGPDDIERYRRRTEAKIIYNRGTMLAQAGDHLKAQEEFATALEVDPSFVDAAYNLGVVLLAAGDTERAVAVLEQTVAMRPDEPLTEFALGKAHFDAGRTINALVHFDRAVELDPSLEDARFARAVALLEIGRRDSAIVALDSYLREFPDGVWAAEARSELTRLANESVSP